MLAVNSHVTNVSIMSSAVPLQINVNARRIIQLKLVDIAILYMSGKFKLFYLSIQGSRKGCAKRKLRVIKLLMCRSIFHYQKAVSFLSLAKKLGDQCFYDQTCLFSDENAICMQIDHNAICQCREGFHLVSHTKPMRRTFCTQGDD